MTTSDRKGPEMAEILSSVRRVLTDDDAQRAAEGQSPIQPRQPLSPQNDGQNNEGQNHGQDFLQTARLTELLGSEQRSVEPIIPDEGRPSGVSELLDSELLDDEILVLTDPIEDDVQGSPEADSPQVHWGAAAEQLDQNDSLQVSQDGQRYVTADAATEAGQEAPFSAAAAVPAPIIATVKPDVVADWLRGDEGRALLKQLVREELRVMLSVD